MRYAARPVPAIEATAHLEQTRASRGLTSVFRRARGRKKCAEKFRFYRLRKSKGEGLLELFWGGQPPFALLRSVEGGSSFSFFSGASALVSMRRPSPLSPVQPIGVLSDCDLGVSRICHHARRPLHASRAKLERMAESVSLTIGNRRLSISNPGKVFYN